jgi:hypothetical protein
LITYQCKVFDFGLSLFFGKGTNALTVQAMIVYICIEKQTIQ